MSPEFRRGLIVAGVLASLAGGWVFMLKSSPQKIILHWRTGNELNHAGFYIDCTPDRKWSKDSATRLNSDIIPSKSGDSIMGKDYEWEVPACAYYWLVAVDAQGEEKITGPVTVER